MKKINLRTLVIYALAALSGVVLLYTSQSVQKAEDRLTAAELSARSEAEAIQVLRAEWAYLNNPARLEILAKEFLSLEPVDPDQIITQPSVLRNAENADVAGEADLSRELKEGDGQYREVSYPASVDDDQNLDATAGPVAVPRVKPAPPARKSQGSGRRIQKQKSFNTLLDELGGEG